MPWGVIIAIGIIVVLVLIIIGIYNGLIQRRLRVDEALGQIEVQLKRRWDLIPNLIQRGQGLHGLRAGGARGNVTNARANAVAAGAKGPAVAGHRRERPDLVRSARSSRSSRTTRS